MNEPIQYRLAELERRMWNLLRFGTIQATDYPAARVKVQSGDMLTGWIPWMTRRASSDVDWWAPELGEQVLLLSPCGDPAQAVALPALYQLAHPAPEQTANIRRINFGDGTVVIYDRSAKKLSIECVGEVFVNADGNVSVESQGNVSVESAQQIRMTSSGNVVVHAPTLQVNGNISATGSVIDGSGNTNHHVHP
jgi:phage baseplate assembly protein V